jgi:hypothetical protein
VRVQYADQAWGSPRDAKVGKAFRETVQLIAEIGEAGLWLNGVVIDNAGFQAKQGVHKLLPDGRISC